MAQSGLSKLIAVNNTTYTNVVVTIPTKIVQVKEDGYPSTDYYVLMDAIVGSAAVTQLQGEDFIFTSDNWWQPGDICGKLKIVNVGSVNFQQIETGTT